MKKRSFKSCMISLVLAFVLSLSACAYPTENYNTQRGAATGAAIGAILGQAIGRNTEGTLLGMAVGTVLGSLVGNAEDQRANISRQAARTNKVVVYYDSNGNAIEAIPSTSISQQTNCKKITTRTWQNGQIISDRIEEVCTGDRVMPTY